MNQELLDVQTEFRKGRGTRDQIASVHWIMEKAREFQRNIFIDYAKAFDCVDHNKLWEFLKRWEYQMPFLSPEKPVYGSRRNRTRHGTTDWFKIGKGVGEELKNFLMMVKQKTGKSCLITQH